jgi:hypothetical protein
MTVLNHGKNLIIPHFQLVGFDEQYIYCEHCECVRHADYLSSLISSRLLPFNMCAMLCHRSSNPDDIHQSPRRQG